MKSGNGVHRKSGADGQAELLIDCEEVFQRFLDAGHPDRSGLGNDRVRAPLGNPARFEGPYKRADSG
jgi:hypothetical protein